MIQILPITKLWGYIGVLHLFLEQQWPFLVLWVGSQKQSCRGLLLAVPRACWGLIPTTNPPKLFQNIVFRNPHPKSGGTPPPKSWRSGLVEGGGAYHRHIYIYSLNPINTTKACDPTLFFDEAASVLQQYDIVSGSKYTLRTYQSRSSN